MTPLTQHEVDMAISDLDPDLPWNRPAVDIDIERLDQELARHRQALKRDEMARSAAVAGFTVAVIAVIVAVVVWALSRYLIA